LNGEGAGWWLVDLSLDGILRNARGVGIT